MTKLRIFCHRLLNTLRKPRTEEFTEELEAHLALDTERGIAQGLSPQEARRQALVRLGGVTQVREAYAERRLLPWLSSLLRDLSYCMRSLARSPQVTVIAIVSIGLGIGANTTIFSMVSRFVLRPAPVGDPASLVSLHILEDNDACCNPFSWPVFADLQEQATVFSGMAAYYDLLPASIGSAKSPERVWGQGVTPNFFQVAAIPMVSGRGFHNSEDREPVVVLSERLWNRRFHRDANIIGSTVMLSGHAFTVTGIVPAAFHSIDQILNAEFWVPLGMTPQLAVSLPPHDARDYHWLSVIGRIRAGAGRNDVVAALNTIASRLAKSYPATDKNNHFVFEQAGTLPPRDRGSALLFLTALSVVVLLVLAIAGFNVANLLFARALGRQREFAVRAALGATRSRLLRLFLFEGLIFGLGGGALGVLLALWSTHAISSLRIPAPVPLDLGVAIDGRTLAYTALLSVLAGVLLGVAPAWAASLKKVAGALKGDVAFARSHFFSARHLLVMAQVAMALVLLSVTGLFLRSLKKAAQMDIGFKSEGLLLLSVDPRLNGYSPQQTSTYLATLRRTVATLPGVEDAVSTDVAMLSGGNRSDGFTITGRSNKGDLSVMSDLYMVTPRFFQAMGMPLVRGEDFRQQAIQSASTDQRFAVVNQAFAEKLFGNANPVGQHVSGGKWQYEIIGVVGNAKSRSLGEPTRAILYRSLDQSIADDPSMMGYTLVVRTAGDAAALAPAVRSRVQELDPAVAIYNVETMEQHVQAAYVLPRLAAALFGVFGGIGLLLATVGLYGVMSFGVTRSLKEISIRMAVGAEPAAVLRLVLRRGLALTLPALAIGWPAAWLVARLASAFLYGVGAHDALTFTLVPIMLLLVALAASWIPARRAAATDPMEALRME